MYATLYLHDNFYLQQHNINDNIFMKNFTLKKAIKVFATKKKNNQEKQEILG